ncbi:hypothetical protein C9926_02705 [Sulfurovum lithotrophicum]|nr:hypothetical protein C9926_02705 [Sulfurovum lithotrophicum]
MENTKELLLIHTGMKRVNSVPSTGVNIMLTPQFYTLKREALPVKYAYQAKRIAPSLFEGLIEDLYSHKYFVEKEDEGWLFIAYDEEKIKTFLESKGIATELVSKIYFAEQAKDHFKSPVLLGENDALVNLNGTMTVVPQIALNSDETPMQITTEFTPKKGISLEGSAKSFLPSNEAYTLAAIFVLFAMIYFVEGSRYGGENAAQEEEMNSLLENHPSLQSSYTRESIASKYKTIDKKERKKRDIIKSLSQMIFKGSTLVSLSIDDRKFQAHFACKDKAVSTKLKELAKKEKFNTSKVANSNDVKIEGTL